VQGPSAPAQLINALKVLDDSGLCDVIIIGRGGGSAEDLWCFNDENLAYAVYNCKTPIISAVGHETDFTICDFVADLRAPTPSAAAELAVPDKMELKGELLSLKQLLFNSVKGTINNERANIRAIEQKEVLRNPIVRINENRKDLVYISERIENLTANAVNLNKNKLGTLAEKLNALSPLGVVARGYSLVENKGKIVKSVADVSIEDEISMKLSDGSVVAKVLRINEG
jgi:exodeoxyribonuclease VII large subunit